MQEHNINDPRSKNGDSIPTSLLMATQNLVRAYLQEAYAAYIYGRNSFFEKHKIDPTLIPLIQNLQPFEIDQCSLNYARTILSSPHKDGLTININKALSGILIRCNENNLADRFLAAGASNTIMKEFFSIRAKECSLRRNRLGINTGTGRKSVPKEESLSYEMATKYDKALKETQCPRQALLSVHEETGHFIDTIFRLLEKNKEYQLQE